jgi:hypothetical protein
MMVTLKLTGFWDVMVSERNLLLPLQGKKKLGTWHLCAKLRGVRSMKIVMFTFTAMST